MKTKVLPVLALGACSMLIGCNRLSSKNLTYEEAKTWVKTYYGEGSKEGKVEHPTAVKSTWFVDGVVNDTSLTGEKRIETAVGYLQTHFTNLFVGYANVTDEQVKSTELTDREATQGKFGYKTSNELQSNAPEDFYYSLESVHLNDTLDYFYKGPAKYSAKYKAYSDKTLEISGNYYYSYYVEGEAGGTHVIEIPYLTTTFNSKGAIKQIKFDFAGDASCHYAWISSVAVLYSASIYFDLFKGTNITINFEY